MSAHPAAPWRASPPPPDSSPRRGACAHGSVLLGFAVVTLFFWGSLADLEHALAVGLVLFVDRSLRFQRTTVREQRLIAFVSVLAVLAIEVLTFLVPTDGPFGHTDATGRIDHRRRASTSVIILIIANGLRRGRRWAWVLGIILGVVQRADGVALRRAAVRPRGDGRGRRSAT